MAVSLLDLLSTANIRGEYARNWRQVARVFALERTSSCASCEEPDRVCEAAVRMTRHGSLLADCLPLMTYCGRRMNETLRVHGGNLPVQNHQLAHRHGLVGFAALQNLVMEAEVLGFGGHDLAFGEG